MEHGIDTNVRQIGAASLQHRVLPAEDLGGLQDVITKMY